MPPPSLIEGSSPQGNRGDGRITPSDCDGDNDCKEKFTPLELFSFVPIIQMLPGLVLEDQTYHVEGPLLAKNLNGLKSFARRVEELTLTDTERSQYHEVSPDIITRLAMIQDTQSPGFLSSLKHLRLVDVDSELSYLWFCLTPSIQSLELGGIPPNRQITVTAFLKELVLKAPQLAKIVLGPEQLTTSIFQGALQFTHLRQLEIRNILRRLDFSYLKAVSALPYLEIFSIDTSTAGYTAYTPSATTSTESIYGETVSLRDGTDGAEFEIPYIEQHAVPFPCLATLSIMSNAPLVCDLIFHLFPKGVKQLSLTLICDRLTPFPYDWLFFNTPHWSTVVNEALRKHPRSPIAQSDPSMPVVEIPFHTFKTDKGHKRICHGDREEDDRYICEDCITQKRERITKEERKWADKYVPAELCFTSAIDKISEMGSVSSICIDFQDITLSAHSIPSELHSATLSRLLACTSLVRLDIRRWAVPSVTRTFDAISSTLASQMSMLALLLPLEAALNPGITLSTLRRISRLYPQLISFQCRFTKSRKTVDAAGAVSHVNLKELRVSGYLHMTMDDKIKVASYIYSLFPRVENIAALAERDLSPWTSVDKLVKMCQKVASVRCLETSYLKS